MKITINGSPVEVSENKTVLEVARDAGVFVPTLCNLPEIENRGYCRLCTVEINGKFLPACSIKAEEGMIVTTDSEEIQNIRKAILEMIFKDHFTNCPECIKCDTCELQKCATKFNLKLTDIYSLHHSEKITEIVHGVNYDARKCILCMRCVNFLNKKYGKKILEFRDGRIQNNEQCSDADIVDICPTGALFLTVEEGR